MCFQRKALRSAGMRVMLTGSTSIVPDAAMWLLNTSKIMSFEDYFCQRKG